MLFTSYNFIAFITLVFILYYSIPKKWQWPLLLVSSYFFYFVAGKEYLVYIVVTTVSTFLVSLGIEKLRGKQTDYLSENKDTIEKEDKKKYKAGIKKRQWQLLLGCLIINLGILAFVKYSNFSIANINTIFKITGSSYQLSFLNLVLPMGISFYTFQAVGYIIDVYRGKVAAEKNLFKLALFVSFFPQLVQGPISRFSDLAATLYEHHAFNIHVVSFGIQRILWGLFKKLVIADRILVGVNSIIRNSGEFQGAYVLVGMLFYAFELYADFTGGIDITIGIAEVMGIRVKENFIRPYFSKSIKEYWRRWHISMSTWFTDYIFYPISVCQPMLKLSRFSRKHFGDFFGKRIPVYISVFVVWFATGVWHGASWNFIVWGVMNGVVIMISQEFIPLYEKFHKRFDVEGKFYYRAFQVIRTILLMSSLRMFDCYRDVGLTFKMFGNMFINFGNIFEVFNGGFMKLGLTGIDYLILLFGFTALFSVSLIQRKGSVREFFATKPTVLRYSMFGFIIIVILLFGAYGVGFDARQFIYNQF
ncbi:MAG: MBOAT family O-acyltransferase [Clostridia bacterium]|jgi:D-alanyl-lipoteichoic acid acyltransferase DltB (MBOAT superfamily)